jgi:hypothetical protein
MTRTDVLEEMLNELESSCLEVILVPELRRTCEGGCRRVAVSKNALWYRQFCAAYLSTRKRRNLAPDTCIRRRETINALRRMIAGKASPKSHYVYRLELIAEQRLRRSALARSA